MVVIIIPVSGGGGAGVYRVGSVFLRAGVNCKVQVGEVI